MSEEKIKAFLDSLTHNQLKNLAIYSRDPGFSIALIQSRKEKIQKIIDQTPIFYPKPLSSEIENYQFGIRSDARKSYCVRNGTDTLEADLVFKRYLIEDEVITTRYA